MEFISEACSWRARGGTPRFRSLNDSRPKQLFSPARSCIYLHKKSGSLKVEYIGAPSTRSFSRRGVLSTTGHIRNFVMWIEIPSNKMGKQRRQGRPALVGERRGGGLLLAEVLPSTLLSGHPLDKFRHVDRVRYLAKTGLRQIADLFAIEHQSTCEWPINCLRRPQSGAAR